MPGITSIYNLIADSNRRKYPHLLLDHIFKEHLDPPFQWHFQERMCIVHRLEGESTGLSKYIFRKIFCDIHCDIQHETLDFSSQCYSRSTQLWYSASVSDSDPKFYGENP